MRVVIAGSRTINSMLELEEAIYHSCFKDKITEVVSGTARGADQLGEAWAIKKGIPIKRMPAEWDKFGKRAGPIRNAAMANYADGAIVLWDGESRGALNMIQNIKSQGKPFFINVVIQPKVTK